MLKRAGVSMVVALIAAVWGFSDVLRVTAPFGRIVFFIAAAFCGLSLLFSLFEATPEHESSAEVTPQGLARQISGP